MQEMQDAGSILGSGRFPGNLPGNCNSLQYSCWENSMTEEPGRLQSTGLQSETQLSFHLYTHVRTYIHTHTQILVRETEYIHTAILNNCV